MAEQIASSLKYPIIPAPSFPNSFGMRRILRRCSGIVIAIKGDGLQREKSDGTID